MDESDDDDMFSDDDEEFILMTPAITMSQKIVSNSTASEVPFTHSMLNVLGDRLHNILKNYQFRSPFDSKLCRPGVPLTKALALMKKIKQDTVLHRYMITILIRCKISLMCYNLILTMLHNHILTFYSFLQTSSHTTRINVKA
jgi:hypothetical protein